MTEPQYRVELTFAPDLRDRVERWRGRQMPVLTRAEAVRRLVLAGLEAGGATPPVADAPAPVNVAGDIPPPPDGNRRGPDVQVNAKLSAGASDLVTWAEAALGTTKRAALDRLIRDGAMRLARELAAAPEQ